jgi:hypothetical protein
MLLTLSGCATSGPRLPPVPDDLNTCFDYLVPAPNEGPLTKAQIVDLIGQLKASELEKSHCGKRLLNWYNLLISKEKI